MHRDIHVTQVLTNYHTAVQNNAAEAESIPADILLKTHGALPKTMSEIIMPNATLIFFAMLFEQ